MDELEILKKDWKKNENTFDQVSEKEIYGMLHKRSSSIVKWILIISVLELLLWSGISFLTSDESYSKTLKAYHLDTIMPVITIINYGVILFFIYLFFKNYKAINTTDTVKQLMQNILKTRKTVQYYVWYNINTPAAPEITDITTVGDVSQSLSGKKFKLFSPSQEYYAWFSMMIDPGLPLLPEIKEDDVASSTNSPGLPPSYST